MDEIRIARYLGDKSAALSFTVDDGFKDATEEFVTAFAAQGFKVTWFVNPGVTTEDMQGYKGRTLWPRWRDLKAAGHEIGNHGLTHAKLTELDAKASEQEINTAFDVIERNVGTAPFSYCAAFGARDESIDKAIAVKHKAQTGTRKFYGGDAWTLELANRWVDGAIARNEWVVPMLHNYSKGYAAFKVPVNFDAHLKFIKDHADCVWVAPFGVVSKNVQGREAAKLESKKIENGIEFLLTSTLDAKVFDQPLTVVITNGSVKQAEARREGNDKPISIRIEAQRLLLEVMPGPKAVTVRWSK